MGNLLLSKARINILIIGIFVLFTILAAQLFRVQVVQASNYQEKAANEMQSTRTIPAQRGEITDINGVAFARSVSAITIVVDQTQITDPARVANFVAPILGLSAADVQENITGTRKYSIVLKNGRPALWDKLTEAIYEYNKALDDKYFDKRIIGFFPERSYIREYPSGQLISSLVGFVRADGIGATGIESSLNSIITGTDGKYSYARGYGAEIPGSQREIVAAKAGTNIRLTINRDVQWVASKAIADAVKSANAVSGTVIVMDPKTGAIVAHATAPTFNPNNTKNVPLALMRNPSVQDVYEPGSTGKVMTMAAALEEKTITPTTVFTVPYMLKRGGSPFHDHEPHPTQQLTSSGILAVSSNTGTIKVGETMSNDTLHSYLTRFGIGIKTGSGLPGESAGLLRPVSNWSGTTAPTVAFGQGYSVTAMQATSVFATIANNGVRVSPTVIAGTSDPSGHFTPTANRSSVRVVSEDTAIKLRLMMESVVSSQGTAPSAAIPGYRVAGKTGTAMRYDQKTGRYSGYTASFIGFAPADAPRYVISVTLQDPRNGHYGGSLGGPVFKKVMTFVLQSEHVAPTGTKVLPVALTKSELTRARATQVSAKKQ
ncbi:cell division protein FtsI (penicillin-binding protein 3) [Candidatus Planktophila sulfonica]|uniref:Cell division protein FtsI (Penicillin-binding protein 3) n=1 Tax=Candidatus Planktophila sulfonica TaxID=1884904 RepID=A0A249KGJ7_9ACTN|nr:penicillin-binding protein 2 [Candidatus Planktophila sulfonica]ASY15825.1 cell division protein FtsI (penicillin-binding protein 3) [Candidatus Planktophila sulfonica]